MFNHEPKNYRCPLCAVVKGIEGKFPYTRQADIIYKDDFVISYIASHWWPNNPGHILVSPLQHYENGYDVPSDINIRIYDFMKYISLAMRISYKCEGISIRQHNEPAGDQDLWHFHVHVFPRYTGDDLYKSTKGLSETQLRLAYVKLIKEYMSETKYQKP
ncbi:MAG: HIT family protein [Candidatus Dojkabacteria bacterium]|jgi:histidine triad (HIT) family protein|nr:HIT family protein [Candidatus Dojkabacteria bacterium]